VTKKGRAQLQQALEALDQFMTGIVIPAPAATMPNPPDGARYPAEHWSSFSISASA
jgi:hypothetical protein